MEQVTPERGIWKGGKWLSKSITLQVKVSEMPQWTRASPGELLETPGGGSGGARRPAGHTPLEPDSVWRPLPKHFPQPASSPLGPTQVSTSQRTLPCTMATL